MLQNILERLLARENTWLKIANMSDYKEVRMKTYTLPLFWDTFLGFKISSCFNLALWVVYLRYPTVHNFFPVCFTRFLAAILWAGQDGLCNSCYTEEQTVVQKASCPGEAGRVLLSDLTCAKYPVLLPQTQFLQDIINTDPLYNILTESCDIIIAMFLTRNWSENGNYTNYMNESYTLAFKWIFLKVDKLCRGVQMLNWGNKAIFIVDMLPDWTGARQGWIEIQA